MTSHLPHHASDDYLPRIAQTLAGLDTDPDVLTHLRTTAHRASHAAGS
ncbi:hypothetical protein AB5J72_03205 [Streptomyces sp. CG1]